MSAHWYYVEVTDSDHGPEPLGELLAFCVAPSLAVFREQRSQDQVERDATAKGYELVFCSSYSGIGRYTMEKLTHAILRWLKAHGYDIKNRFDINIEPKVRILIHAGPECHLPRGDAIGQLL